MQFPLLTEDQKHELEARHRRERDKRVCDRIKAVLLKSEGWPNRAIAQALRVREETIQQHLSDWLELEKLKPDNGGSTSKLNLKQTARLMAHLEAKLYVYVADICRYVAQVFGVEYTISGMTKWLKQHGFSYKHPKEVPAKADIQKQAEFIETYLELVDSTPREEPIVFMDSTHPTMATKVACGWIKKGKNKPIAQTASRTRVNVMGAVELTEMKVTSCCPEYVNAETTVAFLHQLKAAYPSAPKLHIILDQSGYHKSKLVQHAAQEMHITLHYLPPYSPNLNPIERLWKIMNEQVRNNVFFDSAKQFRETISNFFELKIPQILPLLKGRINDNFQTLKPGS